MDSVISTVLNAVLAFLPTDPLFTYIESISMSIIDPLWLSWLNWLVPIHDMIIAFGLWLTAVFIYLAIKLFISAFEAFKPL